MAKNEEDFLKWRFYKECEAPEILQSLLVQGEEVLKCYSTGSDVAALTNKRFIVMDSQGFLSSKKEIFSLPYRSIDMWSSENASKGDMDVELEMWTKAGHFKLKLDKKINVRELDLILANGILN